MESQLPLPLSPVTQRQYRPRGINELQRLLKEYFQSLADQYEARHAMIYGRFRDQFLEGLKAKKVASSAITEAKILSREEIRIFIARCPDPVIGPMFEFLARTGLRISEMLGIRMRDLKAPGRFFDVRIFGKGRKDQVIRVPWELVDRVRQQFQGETFLFEHNGQPYRREYESMRIKRLGRKILAREISAHTLRHSRATDTIKRTGRVKAVTEQLGHSSAKTTLDLYVHNQFTAEELEALWLS